MTRITKMLSANDCGVRSHQSGILIPKNPPHVLKFFPELNEGELNPRLKLFFKDVETDEMLELNFIHYNNKYFGKTRNEYRLTGISKYLKEHGASPGDLLHITDRQGKYFLEIEKKRIGNKIKLTEGWQ